MNRLLPVLLLTSAIALFQGCASDGASTNNGGVIRPADFSRSGEQPDTEPHEDLGKTLKADEAAEESGTAPAQPPVETGPSAPDTGEPAGSAAPPAAPGAASADAQSYSLDAMVGQVNGKAIYADTVLGPLSEDLQRLGRQLPLSQFRQRAEQLIGSRLDEIVSNALILGEAERDLSEREQGGLKMMVARKREDLLRQHGRGSVSLAEHNIVEETGQTLDQALEDYRQRVLIDRYNSERVRPRIQVARRDIDRYYREHQDEFAGRSTRVLRLIRVQTQAEADEIESMLRQKPFPEAATDKLNLFRPAQGGLMEEIVGPTSFDSVEMNEAVEALREGQWTGPYEFRNGYVFAYVEKLTLTEGLSREEAMVEIEGRLQRQRYRELFDREHRRRLEEGSYNPISEMTDALVRIAVARYAVR